MRRFHSLSRLFRRSGKGPQPSPSCAPPPRLQLEGLEGRLLLSAAAPALDPNLLAADPTSYDHSSALVRFDSKLQSVGLQAQALVPGTQLGRPLGNVPGLYEVHVSAGADVKTVL